MEFLRLLFRVVFLAVAAAAALGVILGGALLADWIGRTYDVVWAVAALLLLPLIGAAMTLRDQLPRGRVLGGGPQRG